MIVGSALHQFKSELKDRIHALQWQLQQFGEQGITAATPTEQEAVQQAMKEKKECQELRGDLGVQMLGFFFWILLFFKVFRPETANSETRFGILVNNQPWWQIFSQSGAVWTHVVALFRSRVSKQMGGYPKNWSWRAWAQNPGGCRTPT